MPNDTIPQFPHCDSAVLHSPAQNCEYCNRHPNWQSLREYWRINFTGETDPTKAPCPSTRLRDLETINRWPGNRVKPPGSREIEELEDSRALRGIGDHVEEDEQEYSGGVDREPEDDMPPTGQPPRPSLLGLLVTRLLRRWL